MPDKLHAYTELASRTAGRITDSYQEWTAFLATAGRLYKYPFPEQLLIYTQRPDATACADFEVWNRRMRRYVRRGAQGIALIDYRSGKPSLRYVFDIADTGGDANSLRPWLWRYDDKEHAAAVSAALTKRFGKTEETDVAAQMDEISERLAQEY